MLAPLMRRVGVLLVVPLLAPGPGRALADDNWPQFRGPNAGVADGANLPLEWGTSTNVEWSIPVAGRGWSSPIVWGDKIFLTSVEREGEYEDAKKGLYFGGERAKPADAVHRWVTLCLDLKTGKQLWRHVAAEGKPETPIHIKNSYASETPVTDGERLYALFGNKGLYCYTLDGELLWSKPLEARKTKFGWGTAASPVLHDGRLYVLNDNEDQSYLFCLDAKTGSEIWRVERDEKSNWATPFIWENDGRTELITSGTGLVRSYSLDGELLWELDAFPDLALTIPTPLSAHGMLYVGSGYVMAPQKPLVAIKPGAKGDAKGAVAWTQEKAAPYNPSFLVYGDHRYVLYDRGLLSCFDAKTGEAVYERERIGGQFTVSPWASDGKIYCLDEDGKTTVVKAGPDFEILGTNDLGEMCMATPAVAGDRLLIRTLTKLYCIRKGAGDEQD